MDDGVFCGFSSVSVYKQCTQGISTERRKEDCIHIGTGLDWFPGFKSEENAQAGTWLVLNFISGIGKPLTLSSLQ